jgi:DNA-binding winged helix-turn-helix (wHTH) protein/dienelactone hydrolase
MEEERRGSGGSIPAPTSIRFGPYELDLRSAELRKNDLRIRLQHQPFQILIALLERPGEVVLREEIRHKLWPDDTVVEFDHGINAAVKRLRDALCESAEKPRYIETLARRGYRFIGKVEAAPSLPMESAASQLVSPNGLLKRAEDLSAQAIPEGRLIRSAPETAAEWFPRHRILIPSVLVALLVAALAGTWFYYRRIAPARWARAVALPEVTRLVNAGDYAAAFPFLHRAQQILPRDPALNKIRREISFPTTMRTSPSGTHVYAKPYRNPNGEWIFIGESPIKNFLLPSGYYRWKITKAGFRTVEGGAGFQGPTIDFTLDREGSVPLEMVHVPTADSPLFGLNPVHLGDYWMDKYEVTNRQFKDFVDKGGYDNRRYWREEFIKEGSVLSWERAMAEFRDATGRPGPASWEVGNYAPAHDDFPVGGVSWYEAMAYAEFAHKRIPTVFHWFRAADQGIWSDILRFSNFASDGSARVGSHLGIGPFGTYDMAGNVKEWCLNAAGNRRYILGGGWTESSVYYAGADALSPFDRSPANGFRCVKYPVGRLPEALTQPVAETRRDHRTEKPVSDGVFRILHNFYSYDRTEFKAVREAVDESSLDWKSERITFDAAYDRQRLTAWLYLPRNAKPPFQTIIYHPAGSANVLGSIDEVELKRFAFLMKTGRAVLLPIYAGTYGRTLNPSGTSTERDLVIQHCKEVQRSIDYLETRPDIARGQLGYYGISAGARLGLIVLAQETRIRAALLSEGGLSNERKPPEIDEINFAPRVRIPVLMANGRYDFAHPLETDQAPLFRLLGSPEKDKRHLLFETGHVVLQPQQFIKEALNWFDKYLGPIRK